MKISSISQLLIVQNV